MDAIVAVYSDWGIGTDGTQPIVLHADRIHFQKMTMGSTIIAGRKTLEDFPNGRPLKGRKNIVITSQEIEIEGAIVVHDVQAALDLVKDDEKVYVVGGATVYMQFLPYVDTLYVTKLEASPESTAYFPNLDKHPDWDCIEHGNCMEENGIKYCFCTYKRV